MKAGALPVHGPRAVVAALAAHGWEAHRAEAAASGLGPVALHLREVPAPAIEALVVWNGKAALDLLTGPDWVIIAGTRSRVSALARPWTVPPELSELAVAVGMALPADPVPEWVTARGRIALERGVLVGIVNATPDSFSDAGALASVDAAVAHAARLLVDGATMLDVGGESTRPGAAPVPVEEELRRAVPVVEALVRRFPDTPVSIDTVKAPVARAALGAGAWSVNDVSGLRLDPAIAAAVRATGAGIILMHSRGAFSEMATFEHTEYPAGVVDGVAAELGAAVARATGEGIAADRIVVDPGFGFSKTAEQNLALLDGLAGLAGLGRPMMVGPSRKRFLGHATGRDLADRDRATAAACLLAWERGARLFRVHEPAAVRDALALARSVGGA
ncbi:MAG TPA: dihydropteroate synthase [Gemmatimonadales bacterium]|nr:dihydropteroate synthase [Gemmatimonadales bacterium]